MASKYMIFTSLLFAAISNLVAAQSEPGSSVAPAMPTGPATTPPPPPEPMPKRSCTTAGIMCSDCNNQAVCIGNGDNTFMQIENKCGEGKHCLGETCVEGAKCNFKKFSCTCDGFFPDPYDCTKYHVCASEGDKGMEFTHLEMNCGDSRGSYDASTSSCGFPMNSTACIEGPVPRCLTSLQFGMLKSDPSIYYLCTEDEDFIGPELYKCSGGKIFDAGKVSCVPSKKSKKAK